MAGPFLERKPFLCREWVFLKLTHCLEQRPVSKTCGAIVVGGPGSGKTSLCCEMVWPSAGGGGRLQRALHRRLLAYYFCQSHNVNSLSVSDFVRSLVTQILGTCNDTTTTSPTTNGEVKSPTVSCRSLCEQYAEKIRSDPEIQAALRPDVLDRDPDEALQKGLLFPLLEIEPPKQCLFLLVDSIDETSVLSSGNQYSHEAKSGSGSKTIAELLANHHHLFPQWLLLVCTARRQSKNISRMFTGFRKISLDDLRKSQVVRDVQQYILSRIDSEDSLRQHLCRDTVEMLNQLHIKSNGCFLYLEKVLDGVAENFIILREIREIPGTLNGLYLWLCQRLFHRKHFAKVQPILNIILASRKALTISEIFEAIWTSNTQMTRQDFNKRLHLLRRVLRLSSDGTLLLFHHSFAEWLLDVKHCTKKYLCNASLGHSMLAMSYSLKAKNLGSEDIQNFALHLTRMPAPSENVVKLVEKYLHFDYNTILVLWLIQSGANVENCLVVDNNKKNEIVDDILNQKSNCLLLKKSQSYSKRKCDKNKGVENSGEERKEKPKKLDWRSQSIDCNMPSNKNFESCRKRTSSVGKRIIKTVDNRFELDQRFDKEKIPKYENPDLKDLYRGSSQKHSGMDVKSKVRIRNQSVLKSSRQRRAANLVNAVANQNHCQYEKLKESYEDLEFEPYGRRDLETRKANEGKRISEEYDYDHLEFDLAPKNNKTDLKSPDIVKQIDQNLSNHEIISETNDLLEQLTNLEITSNYGAIKKDETGFFETNEKSPDFLKNFNEQNFKFSTLDSENTNKNLSGSYIGSNFLKLDSEDSGFLKSEDTSTLGLRSDGQMTLSSTNDDVTNTETTGHNLFLRNSENNEETNLTREEELDILLNGLEKSLNEETSLLDESFLSQITQNSFLNLKNDSINLDHGSLSSPQNESDVQTVDNFTHENPEKDLDNSLEKENVKFDEECFNSEEITEVKSGLMPCESEGAALCLGSITDYSQDNNEEATTSMKELTISNILEMLQIPKDPKVLKILTEAGAKVSNCNSLQRDGKMNSMEGGIDFISSQVSRTSSPTNDADPLQELLMTFNKETDINSTDSSGRTILHTLAAEGNSTLLQLVLSSYSEINIEAEDKHGQTALNLAARHGYLDVVQVLLHALANKNHADCEGWTALRAAAWGGHTSVVKLLLEEGADVDVADSDQRTALRAAAWGGHEDIVKLLLEHAADVNQTDDEGRTALIAASYMGHSEIVEHLLDYGAEINHEDADGRTALSVAALCVPNNEGYVKVVNILLERGAFVDHQDKDGMTPLLVAAFEGHRDVCELLLEFEADVDHADRSARTPLWAAASMGHSSVVELLLFWGCYVDSIDNEGRTVLSVAAAQGNTDVVRQLLDRGLDEQHRDNSGWTPLHYAAFEGHVEVCEALLEAGAKVDEPDNDGKGPLMLAAQEGHSALVEALLDVHGAPPDQKAHDGKTALRLASLEGHYDIVRILLNHGADVNIKDADGRSTLYILALENRLPMARYILEHGKADVECRDLEGRTPLHVSGWQGHCEMVALLLATGRANVNAVDNENRTALHSASWQGHAPIVRLLLDHGSTPDHTCNQGATALGIASQEGHEACVRALLIHGADPSHSDRCGRNAFRVAAKSGHDSVVKLLEEYAFNSKYKSNNLAASQSDSKGNILTYGLSSMHQYSPVDSPEATAQRRSFVSLSNNSNHSKSSSNLTNSTKSSQHESSFSNPQACLSFTQQLQQCKRSNKHRPLSKMLSPLESEAQSPIYASPPHSPLSDINSPCEPIEETIEDTRAVNTDLHFARDTHMRIILGNTRPESNQSSGKPKRNGIVTNPALRLMSNVKYGLESAAEKIHKTRHDVSSKVHSNSKSNGYQWKKETPL